MPDPLKGIEPQNTAPQSSPMPDPLKGIEPQNLDEPSGVTYEDLIKAAIERDNQIADQNISREAQIANQKKIDAAIAASKASQLQSQHQPSRNKNPNKIEPDGNPPLPIITVPQMTIEDLERRPEFLQEKMKMRHEFNVSAHEALLAEYRKTNPNFDLDPIEAQSNPASEHAKFMMEREAISQQLLQNWQDKQLAALNNEQVQKAAQTQIEQFFEQRGFTKEEISEAQKWVAQVSSSPLSALQSLLLPAMEARLLNPEKELTAEDFLKIQARRSSVKEQMPTTASPYATANNRGKADKTVDEMLDAWLKG